MQHIKHIRALRSLLVILSINLLFSWLITGCSSPDSPPASSPDSPSNVSKTFVGENGQLQVIGPQLCNEKKEPIQLKGISSHSLHLFGRFVNSDSISFMRNDWGITLFRAAMYTEEGGYITNPNVKEKVKEAVQAAIEAGIYVIVDWHILSDGDPNKHKDQAKEFFKEMATLYGTYPNVIYEICNEPNGSNVTWSGSIKPYANEVIPVIREIDPDNIIIVGTDTWSQGIHVVKDDPLEYTNIMYAFHFYAGTHEKQIRDRINYSYENNIPVFVSEWGASSADGSGGIFPYETLELLAILNERKISWANWSLSDKIETSAILTPTASSKGGWTDSDLTESGLLIKYILKNSKEAPFFCDGFESSLFTTGGWNVGGAIILMNKGYKGNYNAILKNGHTMTKSKSTRGYKNIKLEFAYTSDKLNDGDSFIIEWYDGNSWTKLDEINGNNDWSVKEYNIPETSASNADFKIRFSAMFSDTSAKVLLDEVKLIGEKTIQLQ